MASIGGARARIKVSGLILSVFLAAYGTLPAFAQEVHRFDIPATDNSGAIHDFAIQSGVQILAAGDVLSGHRLNSLSGEHSTDEGLHLLLAGTGLKHQYIGARAVALLAAAKPQADATNRVAAPEAQPRSFWDRFRIAQADPAKAASGASTENPDTAVPLEEIVVSGIRRSVQKSLDDKRDANTVADVITAEDIGKLPDNNVAESLSRVPGVQITRRDGDGSTFAVRGISQNRLEINGRSFIGPSDSGQPALESLNPEILSGMEVIKSPSADMTEGALGAIVNLKTKRPLDFPGRVASGRAEGVYANQADEMGYRGSALFADAFLDRTFGVLLSGAYTDADTRGYLFDTVGWTRTGAIDVTGDGVADANKFRPNRLMQTTVDRNDKRLTLNGAIQWRPTEHSELVLESTYSDLDRQRTLNQYQGLLNNNAVGAQADADGTITSGTFNGVTLRPLAYDVPTSFRTFTLGASGKITTGDERLTLSTDFSYSKGEGNDGTPGAPFTYVIVPRAGRTVNVAYDVRNGSREVPNINYTSNYNINDPTQYQLLSVFDGEGMRDNKGYDGRFDVDFRIDKGILSVLETGVRYENVELFSNTLQNLPVAANLLAGRDTNGDGILTVDELPGLNYANQHTGSYYSSVSGAFPRDFLTGEIDKDAARAGFNLPALTLFGPITQGPVSVKAVEEDSYAAYGKANMQGEWGTLPFRGNVGLRYVRTDRIASGYLSATQPTQSDARFTHWLPSGNFALDLTPDLVMRLAAAKVVARPNLVDVGPGFSPNTTNNTGSRGNPNLKPFKATQYDATLEWYFGEASILSGALFRKDVESFTVVTVTQEFVPGFSERFGLFNISQPQNGSDGSVQGFELNYQQAFRSLPSLFRNLGVQVNYTYADSKTPLTDELTQSDLPLPGLSENSYSLVAYYDDTRFSARLAYTRRSKYLAQVQQALNGGSRFNDAFGQLDASASFSITEAVRLTFEAQNLTKAVNRQYDGVETRLSNSALEDQRLYFGIALTL
jgi:iron complex outermembrane receptor protein